MSREWIRKRNTGKLNRRSMCRFIETIQLKDGSFLNLQYHQERMDRTFIRYFDRSESFDLQTFLHEHNYPRK